MLILFMLALLCNLITDQAKVLVCFAMNCGNYNSAKVGMVILPAISQ